MIIILVSKLKISTTKLHTMQEKKDFTQIYGSRPILITIYDFDIVNGFLMCVPWSCDIKMKNKNIKTSIHLQISHNYKLVKITRSKKYEYYISPKEEQYNAKLVHSKSYN